MYANVCYSFLRLWHGQLWLAQRRLSVETVHVPVESFSNQKPQWVEQWLSAGKVQGSNPSAADAGSVTGCIYPTEWLIRNCLSFLYVSDSISTQQYYS